MEDQKLVALLLARDDRGLDALQEKYGPLLGYIIGPILPDPEEQKECLSDVTMLAWDRIGQYDPAKGGFPAWLSALARNAARNRRRGELRRERGREEPDEQRPDPSPGPEEVVLRKERAKRLQKAIDGLGTLDRSIFYRKYYYLQPTAQIAAELGLTQRGVEGRLHRLRKRLRKELGGELA